VYRFAVSDKGATGKGGADSGGVVEEPRKAPRTGASERIGSERISAYHEYTRTKGVNWVLYVVARIFLQPAFLIWFRLERLGREHARHRAVCSRGRRDPLEVVAEAHAASLRPGRAA